MKKSIFLFFAAILCAIGMNAATYTAVGSSGQLFVNTWDPGYTANDLKLKSGTLYELVKEVTLSAGDIQWKIAKDHSWDTSYPSTNQILPINKSGKYKVTFTYNSSGNAVSAKAELLEEVVVLPKIEVKGAWDSWNTVELKKSADNKNASVAVNVSKKGTFEFGINVDGAFTANKKQFTRSDNSTTNLTGNSGNMKLVTDVAGSYIFTWTYDTKTLVITYPAKYEVTATVNDETMGAVSGAGEYGEGNTVTMVATPKEGYVFVSWTKGGEIVSNDKTYSFNVTENVELVANFEVAAEEVHNVTVSYVCGEDKLKDSQQVPSVGVTSAQEVEAPVIFGYTFDSWTLGEDVVSADATANPISINTVAGGSDFTLTANYTEIPKVTVYFVNNKKWSKVYAYGWDGSVGETPAWPGQNITANKEAEKVAGFDVYSYSVVPGSYVNIIFNKGEGGDGNQTETYKWNDGKYYYMGASANYAGGTKEEITVKLEDYYTVAGTEALLGTAWDAGSNANKMAKQSDGSYKLVKENVTLAAIEYEWKIVKNGTDWMDDNKAVNPDGNNKLKITTAGRYNITFTLAADIKSAKAEIELIEAAVVIPDCFISGNKNLTGKETEWLGNEFTMVYNEETETWSYTLAGLQPEKEYALKVICGGTWYSYANLTSIPTGVTKGNDDAIAFKMKEAGDVTVTYNIENGITISGNFYVVVKYDYYITGCEKLGANWGANVEAFGMTDENEDKTYEKALTLAAGEYYLKVTDGTWTEGKNWGSAALSEKYTEISDSEGNIKITLSAEKTFTVKFNSETKKISFEGLTPDETPTKYYIVGSFNEWNTADPNYELILEGEVYKKEVTFAKDVQFKVCDGTWVNSWGKDNLGGKLYNELEGLEGGNLKMKEAKTFTIIFDLANNLITFDGLTEKAPAVVTYVLMGVNNDWTTGIPMTQKANEYVLTCQAIAATDAVKVVKCEDGVATAWYGSVKDGVQVTVNYDADGNIQLPVGTYNFYFDSSLDDKQLWIEAATYTRTATPGSFSTICLPYAGTISGATLFNLSDRDANYVYVVEAGTELVAGKPYVILPTEDKITVTYKNYDYVTAGTDGVALYGTYEDMDATALDGKYVISGNKYYYVDAVQSAGSKLLANRAYFNLNELPEVAPVLPVGARRIALGTNGQNTATGMENVDASAQPVKTIINGQLFILRGEKMYDAQGKLVK